MLIEKVKILDYIITDNIMDTYEDYKFLKDTIVYGDMEEYGKEFISDYNTIRDLKTEINLYYKGYPLSDSDRVEMLYLEETLINILGKYIVKLTYQELLETLNGGKYILAIYLKDKMDSFIDYLMKEDIDNIKPESPQLISFIEDIATYEYNNPGVLRRNRYRSINYDSSDKDFESRIGMRVLNLGGTILYDIYHKFLEVFGNLIQGFNTVLPVEGLGFSGRNTSLDFLMTLGKTYSEDDIFKNFRKSISNQSKEFIYILRGIYYLNLYYPKLYKVYRYQSNILNGENERIIRDMSKSMSSSLVDGEIRYLSNPDNFSENSIKDLTKYYSDISELVGAKFLKSLLNVIGNNSYNVIDGMDTKAKSKLLKLDFMEEY